jgi:hypothetical protein
VFCAIRSKYAHFIVFFHGELAVRSWSKGERTGICTFRRLSGVFLCYNQFDNHLIPKKNAQGIWALDVSRQVLTGSMLFSSFLVSGFFMSGLLFFIKEILTCYSPLLSYKLQDIELPASNSTLRERDPIGF